MQFAVVELPDDEASASFRCLQTGAVDLKNQEGFLFNSRKNQIS